MSSMDLNKLFGAILFAGVVAMIAGFIAKKLVHPEELEQQAYIVDGVAAAVPSDEPEEIPSVLPLLASADVGNGERLSRACAACHTFTEGGANRVGPNLWAIMGATKAHLDDFAYSSALAEMEGVWGYEEMNAFLLRPRAYVPGTKMSYAGMRDVEDRADIIAWMRELDSDPIPLPDPAAIEDTVAPAEPVDDDAPVDDAPAQE